MPVVYGLACASLVTSNGFDTGNIADNNVVKRITAANRKFDCIVVRLSCHRQLFISTQCHLEYRPT